MMLSWTNGIWAIQKRGVWMVRPLNYVTVVPSHLPYKKFPQNIWNQVSFQLPTETHSNRLSKTHPQTRHRGMSQSNFVNFKLNAWSQKGVRRHEHAAAIVFNISPRNLPTLWLVTMRSPPFSICKKHTKKKKHPSIGRGKESHHRERTSVYHPHVHT